MEGSDDVENDVNEVYIKILKKSVCKLRFTILSLNKITNREMLFCCLSHHHN